MKGSKLGNLIGSGSVLGGVFYAISKGKDFKSILFYGAIFGVGGYFLGNSISKFYEQ
jgi:hypothetical protein